MKTHLWKYMFCLNRRKGFFYSEDGQTGKSTVLGSLVQYKSVTADMFGDGWKGCWLKCTNSQYPHDQEGSLSEYQSPSWVYIAKIWLSASQILHERSRHQTYFVTQGDFVMWYLCTVVRLAVFWEPDKWSVSREHGILWPGSFSLQDVWKHVIWGWVTLRFCGHWVIWCCSGVRWNGCIAPVSL